MTDVRLDEGDGTYLVLDARVVKTSASDLMLDSGDRRKGGGAHRRALVHDQNDGLTVNFNGDYPGGVTINEVTEIIPRGSSDGPDLLDQLNSKLPNLKVRGGISYEFKNPINRTRTTVSVEEEFQKLRKEISDLKARVATLEKR